MNAPRIKRGPMTAEALGRDFTQIGNQLFRDPRLTFKAKGVFGLMSTHRDGYGVTPEWIAAAGKDGISAVKGALRELEQYGYLTRSQERNPDGTMGATTYAITDMPSSQPVDENQPAATTCNDEGNRRSEPVDGNPPADEPSAVNHVHKKTNSSSRKNTSRENTISLPHVPAQRTAEPAAAKERETDAAPNNLSTAQRIIRAAGVVTADEEEAFITWVTTTHAPRGGAWWRTVASNGDLPDLAHAWRAQQAPAAPTATSSALPPWCGQCDGEPLAMRWTEDTDGRARRCTRCHPDAAPTWATPAKPKPGGHVPFQCPPAHVYDLGFDGQPLPGTDTTVTGWMALANTLHATEG